MKWTLTLDSIGRALVIDEADGRTVAVADNEKEASLLAAAPQLRKVAALAIQACELWRDGLPCPEVWAQLERDARSALLDARVLPRSF